MAKAIAAGVDVCGNIQDTGRVLISRCIDEGRIGPHAVLVHGTSRGGLAAFHVAAADRRVLAVAAQVPVTHIPALEEFAHLDGNEIIEHANAAALIPRLADRPVFVAVGAVDTRVGEQHCFDFCAALDAASNATTSLFTAPGRSHGGGDPDELRFPLNSVTRQVPRFCFSTSPSRQRRIEMPVLSPPGRRRWSGGQSTHR